ncbi:cyclic nucleotide-binding domain-containing protein [Chitinimonas sp. BJYL2]|uniref:cyclic nucleotide-binding domain-containing protein n=1 Tax=Chitinimonas sp. BJYL2 TaxID=2976696 RepID=UPI0022B3317B|nr:cyclic nucleotide-binding domain-containing protein [Chitinimonas sp. BJYL2]
MREAFQRAFPALAAQLGPQHVDSLLAACKPVELAADRKLFRDRMPVESLYLIIEGKLAVTLEEDTRSISLGTASPGQWLGEVSVLSGSMLGSATVTTLTPCKALKLHYQDFDNLIRDNDHIANALLSNLIELLASRLRVSAAAIGRMSGA